MQLDKDVENYIGSIAQARYPNEACGFIVAKGKKSIAIEMPNEAINPTEEFLMNPSAWIDAEEQGEILAIWHTHTDYPPTPTEADLTGCETSGLPWLLMSVYKRPSGFELSRLVTFSPNGHEQPLIGRPYVYGSFDCWSLVVDYLKRQHGIELGNNYPRLKDFWLNDETNFFDKCFAAENLTQVDDELQEGDVLMFQTDASGHANHVGVYIGEDKILHHIAGRLSTIDIYGGYWKKHTIRHLRHGSKC